MIPTLQIFFLSCSLSGMEKTRSQCHYTDLSRIGRYTLSSINVRELLSLELNLRMHSDETSLFAIYGTAETLHCSMLSQRTHKNSSLALQTPRDLTRFGDHKVMPRLPIYSLFDLERLTQIVPVI